MKRKVKNTRKIDLKTKLAVGVLVLGLSTNSLGVAFANDFSINQDNFVTNSIDDINMSLVLNSLYQEQMEYLVPTIDKLLEFYEHSDTENIIKIGFPEAYKAVKTDLNYYKIYNGVSYEYKSKNDVKDAIINNNKIIGNLKIKPAGNGRDPEYGIIKDNSELGFRIKTNKDKELIDNYTEIVGERFFVDQEILNLIDGLENTNDIEDVLIKALKNTYNTQIKKIKLLRENLNPYYQDEDSEYFIKNSYTYAYDSYSKDLNYYRINYGANAYGYYPKYDFSNVSNEELIQTYIDLIKENATIINNFNIERTGSARDTDYNMIKDGDKYRIKTDKDKEFISKYTELLRGRVYSNSQLIKLFEYSKNYNLKNNVSKKKTLLN